MIHNDPLVMLIPTGRLPVEYQEVEWVQGDNTCWINTGITIAQPMSFDMDLEWLDDTNRTLMGAGVVGSYFYFGKNANRFENGGNTGGSGTLGTHSIHGEKKSDGSSVVTFDESVTVNRTGGLYGDFFHMFCNSMLRDYSNGYTRIMSAQFYDSDLAKTRDFVPCYRKSDGELGMYDLVGGTFYTNAGTGTFTKGADV